MTTNVLERLFYDMLTMLKRRIRRLVWMATCVLAACLLAIAFLTFIENVFGNVENKVDVVVEQEAFAVHKFQVNVDPADQKVVQDPTIQLMSDRRHLIRHQCSLLRHHLPTATDTRLRMLHSNTLNATMCYVPKTGCTFWKRLFILAEQNNSDNNMVDSIFNVEHKHIHFTAMKKMLDAKKFDDAYHLLSNSMRMLFTREPFSRLFSVYVDKFFLASYWSYGPKIIGRHRANPSDLSKKCGHDVTLNEFLKYVTKYPISAPYEGPVEHWVPVHSLCQPCVFDYDIIGHQETFDTDRDYIVNKLNSGNSLPLHITLEDTFRDSIHQLIEKDWNSINFGKIPCVTAEEYLRRIWRALQYQGYLQWNAEFPSEFKGGGLWAGLNISSTTEIIFKATGVHDLSVSQWQARKRHAMVEMFKTVDVEVKNDVRKMFEFDQILFGYEEKPTYVYERAENVRKHVRRY